jgi:hypothetical protein
MAVLVGCDLFGGVETETPTPEQIARCTIEMFLTVDLPLEAKGLKMAEGIDTAMWFKFVVAKQPLENLFKTEVVKVSEFAPDITFTNANLPDWWDVQGKALVGDNVALPNGRYMQVGIEEADDTLTVYIMWYET